MATLLPNFTDKLYVKATATATPYLTVADKLYAKGAAAATPYLTVADKLYAKGAAAATPYLTVADKLYAKGVEKAMPYPTVTGKLYAKGVEKAIVGNQQKWHTLRPERSGILWRSCKLPKSPVVPSSPFNCLSLYLPSAL